mgnify:FL=1
MEKKTNREKRPDNFRLSLTEDVSHREVRSLRFSRGGMIVGIITVFVLVVVAAFCIVAYTPLRSFVPGYPDAQNRRQAVQNAMRIDSLETRILQWELYTENLRRVVSGEEPVRLDSLISRISSERELGSADAAAADSALRAMVAEEERYEISGKKRNLPIEGIHFFVPIKGVVSSGYAPAHPYLEVSAPAGSTVMSVLDGSIVYVSWDADEGYTLVLQHDGDIVSVYGHAQKLLHKVGDRVTAGSPVALLGSPSSASAGGDRLRFELWYEGRSVDPAEYIVF